MQIDFHLAVVYGLSRLAGFTREEANAIASSSQQVDAAIHEGTLNFTNRAAYRFISSAHKMLDYRNFAELANHRVWIPFHFIPGNHHDASLDESVPEFVQRLVCRADSAIAREIVEHCLALHAEPFALQLLGVTLHAYADTWAHQGFSGISHELNRVQEIYDDRGELDVVMIEHRRRYFRAGPRLPRYRKLWRFFCARLLNEVNPVGHGAVLAYPDLPYLKWQYRDWRGKIVIRDNPADFLDAVDGIYATLSAFRRRKGLATFPLEKADRAAIESLLRENRDEEPLARLQVWERRLREGLLSYGRDVWTYQEEGDESWLGQTLEDLEFEPTFLRSDWKLLHDALIVHRFGVISRVLARNGLCVF